jgi:hypothetical protein
MLGDKDALARFWSGVALARRGQADGVAPALEAAPKVGGAYLLWLNRLRAPEGWKRLEETTLDEALEGTTEELLEKFARKAGLKLEIDAPLHRHLFRPQYRIPDGTSLARALDRIQAWTSSEFLMDSQPSRVRYEILLESDRLRVVSLKAGLEFWKAWARDRK